MLRTEIKSLLTQAVRKKYGSVAIPDFSVVTPDSAQNSDYATNVAFLLGRELKKKPLDIAHELIHELIHEKVFRDISVASPGFINFWLSDEVIHGGLGEILKKRKKYGHDTKKKEKIQVEFISANPTGPLTLANGRGGFYGDVLSNVLISQGYQVEREYYINDAGNQIQTLGNSILAVAGIIPDSGEYYHGEYIKKWADKNKKVIKDNLELPSSIGKLAAEDFFKNQIRPSVEKKMKISFGRWTSENDDIFKKGYADKALKIFEKRGVVYASENARWLRTTDFGDDKDRVLMTSKGDPTYLSMDAGHHLQTRKLGFERKINILGADHHGYVSRIQAVAKILGFKKYDVIIMQLVRLVSGGKEVRMSKRKGNFVTIDELIDDVGLDAVRYFFLEKSPDTHMDFDMDLAKEQSVKNPVYYIQYAHARIASIFNKIKNRRIFNFQFSIFKLLKEDEELSLIKKLIQFPEVVEDTAQDYQVHRLTRYTYELARAFHYFYEKHHVITDDKELTQARLGLAGATQVVLQNVLGLLGISAPKKM
jgi:arginyl-tRNA synthetase